jgi:hypothetical protein
LDGYWVWDMHGGGVENCPAAEVQLDYDARWTEGLEVSLTPPPGEWTTEITWEFRTADGSVRSWSSPVELPADVSADVTAARDLSLVTGAVGLLVGRVAYVSEKGARRERGLGGRVVEVTATGFGLSQQRFYGATGERIFETPEDMFPSDVEVE